MNVKIAFVIPYYNHPKKIASLVEYLATTNLDIIIVDDGSNESSKQALRELKYSKLHLLIREVNGGKGAAVIDGFFMAQQLGFTHVFQIDADAQHQLKLTEFINLAKTNPNALICGCPIYNKENTPKSRLYGRKITQFWVHINTLSFVIKDAMCGMRIYPIEATSPIFQRIKSYRMDFDIDILVQCVRMGLEIIWISIEVSYDKENPSHFRMFRDNLKISKLHAKHFFTLPQYLFARRKNGK